MVFSRLFEISIIKTLRFNFHYFGMKAVFTPYVLCSKNVRFESLGGAVELRSKKVGGIRLGFKSVPIFDFRFQRFCWQNDGIVYLGDNVNIGQGSVISNSGKLVIGDNFNISANSKIICKNNITIGDDCLVSWDCLLMDSDWHSVYNTLNGETINCDRAISMGNHIWIGCNSVVLKGSEIPENCVIAAGSVISGRLPKCNSVYVRHNPIKEEINWKY